MALVPYGFKCVNPDCKQYNKEYSEILERDAEHLSSCPSCKQKAQRVFSLSGFSMGFKAGFDVGLGQYVDTQRQRDNICSEKGYRKIS